ncbi:DNA-3-methyladenine glycosylase family protein [Actinomycetospora soli]|uniref:DNA-3-methyladenine glycosylase family protein n=1 Tax=Actinomycetospora soli TaxID=2893887 RepID=UPI001E2CCF06|nr:DNA-3-methyladenine glycosylase 2 family protein [Actinomycetospora soli]MCD2189960.1 DNA-3-methyladenine glycosylase 2 family protein [Actinomycetospora soli]
MRTLETTVEVRGPWSLATGAAFWEGFAPAALPPAAGGHLTTTFRSDTDWTPVHAEVAQDGDVARVRVRGAGDLEAAAAQVARFLALDVDASGWPGIGAADPVIGQAQRALPGLRPCGFHSPYEAAAWAVLAQRLRIVVAARLRTELIGRHGDEGAFPAPAVLRGLDLDLPGRKAEYLHAVADAALEGRLDGAALHHADPERSVADLQQIRGIGPFAAELVVLRGANAPNAVPRHERRLEAEIVERYGPGADLDRIAEAWRPLRTWAAVHLRALREERTREMAGVR